LLAHHGIGGDRWLTGRGDLPGTIGRLAGFEAPAGAWEHDLLPSRLPTYEPEWLDERFTAGELVWGRLLPPRQTDDRRGQPLTRAVPLSLVRRADVAWLLPTERTVSPDGARWGVQAVYEALANHGALFFDDLLSVTGLLPSQLDDALSELAALGLVTSDGFAAIRVLMTKQHRTGRRPGRRRSKKRRRAYSLGGRWSKFPPFVQPVEGTERAERWAWLLLHRYGVMFRDLLARESAAPPWRDLAAVYRRLEMRGEIRGGRFVAGVAGEQFALPEAVETLRKLRDQAPEVASLQDAAASLEETRPQDWQLISAADPLNLVGIITDGPRVPATRNNRIVFLNGRPIAAREAGAIRWLADANDVLRQQALRRLAGPDALRRAEVAVAEMSLAAVGASHPAVLDNSSAPQNGNPRPTESAGIRRRRPR
jgi:ATP-dependent Lhr-like helicase